MSSFIRWAFLPPAFLLCLLLLPSPAMALSGRTSGKVMQAGKRLVLELPGGKEAWFRLRPGSPEVNLPKGLEATVRWTEAGGGKRLIDSLDCRGVMTGKVVSLEKHVLRLERSGGPDVYFPLRWTQTLSGWGPDPWQLAMVDDLRPGDRVSVEYSFDEALRLEAVRRESP